LGKRGISIAFPMADNNSALKSSALRNGLIHLSVTLTDSLAEKYGLLHGPALNAFTKEFLNVVGDVVVAPGKDSSRLVRS
jgi:hypothetical protein